MFTRYKSSIGSGKETIEVPKIMKEKYNIIKKY